MAEENITDRGFDTGPIDTQIDPSQFASSAPVKAEVQTLAPPEDISAATIEDYTPYTADERELGADATVEGRLSGLLSQNNPYIERGRTRGKEFANRRGMLNTSMAAGAVEGAAIDRALPIAQQDASTFAQQHFRNQGYSNEAAKHLADASIARENLSAGFEQDTSQFNAARSFEADRINAAAQNQANTQMAAEANKNNFAVLSADIQGQLKGIDNEAATRLETLTREYSLLENLDSVNGQIYTQLISSIGNIMANEEKVGTATAKVNALIAAAGAEMSFSSGMTGGVGGGGITPIQVPGGGGSFPLTGAGGGSTSSAWANDPPGWEFGSDVRTCFTGDTIVQMCDGTQKFIADVKIGDAVLGVDGEENIVLEYDRPLVGRREVYSFNDGKPFVTAEHPFMTSEGWKALNPLLTVQEGWLDPIGSLGIGDYLEGLGQPLIELKAFEAHKFDPQTPLYNFKLSGNHTYYANGFLVHNKQ